MGLLSEFPNPYYNMIFLWPEARVNYNYNALNTLTGFWMHNSTAGQTSSPLSPQHDSATEETYPPPMLIISKISSI